LNRVTALDRNGKRKGVRGPSAGIDGTSGSKATDDRSTIAIGGRKDIYKIVMRFAGTLGQTRLNRPRSIENKPYPHPMDTWCGSDRDRQIGVRRGNDAKGTYVRLKSFGRIESIVIVEVDPNAMENIIRRVGSDGGKIRSTLHEVDGSHGSSAVFVTVAKAAACIKI
jgi:hypothetical protein